MGVDELRRGIEAIPEAEYHRLSYYQRWIRSITDNLLVRGVITPAELEAALAMSVPSARAPRSGCGTTGRRRAARSTSARRITCAAGGHGGAPPGRLPQPGGPRLRPPGGAPAAVSRRLRAGRHLAGRRRPTFSWRCSNHGCCRSEPAARRERPPARGRARIAGGQGDRHRGGDRRPHPDDRRGQPWPGRPHGCPRLGGYRLPRGHAAGRHAGGGNARHPDARRAAAGRAGERSPGCTTWSSARCAAAIRARCWAIRHSGSNRQATAPVPCATRQACWRNGAPCCRRTRRSAWWTARRTTAGWCCRCARRARKAGRRTAWRPGERGRHDRRHRAAHR